MSEFRCPKCAYTIGGCICDTPAGQIAKDLPTLASYQDIRSAVLFSSIPHIVIEDVTEQVSKILAKRWIHE